MLAEVVATAMTEIAIAAVDASLDGNALADDDVCDCRTDCGDNSSGFMAEDDVLANAKVAVAAVFKVMEVASTEASRDDIDCDLVRLRREEGAVLDE